MCDVMHVSHFALLNPLFENVVLDLKGVLQVPKFTFATEEILDLNRRSFTHFDERQ